MPNTDGERKQWIGAMLAKYEAQLLRYTQRYTGDLERARDVVQDAFIKLCESDMDSVKENPAPWLYTVCRNRALDMLRKDKRLHPLSDEVLAMQRVKTADPAAAAEAHDSAAAIWEALATLPANQQDVVRLRFQDELSYREISDITALSISNVGYLLHVALRSVRERLQHEDAMIEEAMCHEH